MTNNFEIAGDFEVSPAEKEMVGFLKLAEVEFERGERENLENAWDLLEKAQEIADSNPETSDETLCELALLTEKVVTKCQSRGYFDESD